MASLSAPPANWEEAILLAATQFMSARVCFYEVSEDDYDPITGEGGVTAEIVWSGKARVQQLRSPQEFATEYEASSNRTFRFQLDPRDSLPDLYQGAKARVLDGGRDAGLEHLGFTVTSAINSSHMAVRTVELMSTMRLIEWDWDE